MRVFVRAGVHDMLGTTLSCSLTSIVQRVHYKTKLFEEVHSIICPKDNQRTLKSSTNNHNSRNIIINVHQLLNVTHNKQ